MKLFTYVQTDTIYINIVSLIHDHLYIVIIKHVRR